MEDSFWGMDTFQFSVRVDAANTDHVNIAPGSYVNVTGHYAFTGNFSGEPRQHAGGVRGVVQFFDGKRCFNQHGYSPCFVDHAGVSRQDATDARVHTDSFGGFTFENDPNAMAFGSATGQLAWNSGTRFEVPQDSDHLTLRFFISIPRAEKLDVDVHIHSPHDISMQDWTVHDGGFMVVGEEFDPATHVDTLAAQYMANGQHDEALTSGDRIYAGFGPSWYGETQVQFANQIVNPTHNTAARSDLSFHHPNGNTRSEITYAASGAGALTVAGQDEVGTYGFQVNEHLGSGPEDVYLVGWKGETV